MCCFWLFNFSHFLHFTVGFSFKLPFGILILSLFVSVRPCSRNGMNSASLCADSFPNRGGQLMDEILTAGEVAELLQIHPRTVYKLVKEGAIPGRKFGGGWRFSRSEILAMVSPQGTTPPPRKMHTEER
jgi:excisionase family DNA binding protein